MSNRFAAKTTVIFNDSALFYTQGATLEIMHGAKEVLTYLAERDVRFIANFREKEEAEAALDKFDLTDMFRREGFLQIVSPSQETERDRRLNLNPLTYGRALRELGVEEVEFAAAIVGNYAEIPEAKASSIRTVIGFYGSDANELGTFNAQKMVMQRDVAALAGTNLTTANLREIPEFLGYHA